MAGGEVTMTQMCRWEKPLEAGFSRQHEWVDEEERRTGVCRAAKGYFMQPSMSTSMSHRWATTVENSTGLAGALRTMPYGR
jgi:hypothetical protein